MQHHFPSVETMRTQKEVVLFVFGLMRDQKPIIEHVYEKWIDGGKSLGRALIESMFRESGLSVPKDLLHNQLINYYDHHEADLFKDTTPIYIPSKVYWFKSIGKCLTYKHHQASEKTDCNVRITKGGYGEDLDQNILDICHAINKDQQITELHLRDTGIIECWNRRIPFDDEQMPNKLESLNHLLPQVKSNISVRGTNTEFGHLSVIRVPAEEASVKVDKCLLQTETMNNFLQQISDPKIIDITHTHTKYNDAGNIEIEHLSIDRKPEAKSFVYLFNCDFPSTTLDQVLRLVNQCTTARTFACTETGLQGLLHTLLPDSHPAIPQLERISLSGTKLNKNDVQHLSNITQSNKLPKLQEVDLSENILTGCLSCFLPDPNPGLPQLQGLNLKYTGLNKDDLQHLSTITQSNKLPNLQKLYLSRNTLTGCLSCFLPDPHPGLPQLQRLNLWETKLNKDDLQHLSNITQSNKLPNLQELYLSWNTLTGCLSCFLPDPHPGLPQLQKLKPAAYWIKQR